MEEQQRDLRQLVMKRAADRTVAGSGMASPAPRGEPLIQQVLKPSTLIHPGTWLGDIKDTSGHIDLGLLPLPPTYVVLGPNS